MYLTQMQPISGQEQLIQEEHLTSIEMTFKEDHNMPRCV
jgi:hypothetical protein